MDTAPCLCGRWPACLDDADWPCIPYDEPLDLEAAAKVAGFATYAEYREWQDLRELAERQGPHGKPIPTPRCKPGNLAGK